MKKFLVLFISLPFILLAACGNEEAKEEQSNNENTETDASQNDVESFEDENLKEYTQTMIEAINKLNETMQDTEISEEETESIIAEQITVLEKAQNNIKDVNTNENEVKKELMRATETYIVGFEEILRLGKLYDDLEISEDSHEDTQFSLYAMQLLGINEVAYSKLDSNIDSFDKDLLDELLTERVANDLIDSLYKGYTGEVSDAYSELLAGEYVNAVHDGFKSSSDLMDQLYNENHYKYMYYETGLNDATKEMPKKQANEVIDDYNSIDDNVFKLPKVDDAIAVELYNVIISYYNNFSYVENDLE